jgi:peptide/nickel transport system permease protein
MSALISASRYSPARLGLLLLAGVLAIAILAPLLAPHAPTEMFDTALKAQPPSLAHPLGTDPVARDVLSRILHGARVSLGIATLAVLVAISIGTLVGVVAALGGPVVDAILMRCTDAMLAVPRVLTLLLVVATTGPLPPAAFALLIGATGWMSTARLARNETLRLLATEHLRAARALGVPVARLVRRHLLPGLLPTLVAAGTVAFAAAIPLEAGLSFLGLGVQPPDPSWGNIITAAESGIVRHWWMVVFPTVAIVGTVLSAHLVAERIGTARVAP